MYKSFIKYGLVLTSVCVFSCSQFKPSEDIAVATVGDKQLYQSELSDVIPTDLSKDDSILMAEDYINKWIKQELMVQKAEENLSAEQKDVNRELKEYRNSLLIYKYKNELMKQRMDSVVSDIQIEDYYAANSENFKLSKNIVKAIFIKIPGEYADPEMLKSLCEDTSDEGLSELRDYCVQYAKQFDIFIENWVDFSVVLKNIPNEINNESDFLRRLNSMELNDSNYYYLVRIHDYKLKGDIAPVEYVFENIKNLILNRRKIEFLKQIENNVYTEGIRKNKFKIYE